MKTLSTLSTALLLVASLTLSASENGKTKSINAPEMEIGTPDDINKSEVEKLKFKIDFKMPAVNLFNAADVDTLELEQLKVQAPEMIYGSADDINQSEIEALKTFKSL